MKSPGQEGSQKDGECYDPELNCVQAEAVTEQPGQAGYQKPDDLKAEKY
jgi:hypothetical protein